MFTNILMLSAAAQSIRIGNYVVDLWWWPFVFACFKNMFILLDILLLVGIVMVFNRFQKFGVHVYEGVEEAITAGKISTGKLERKWEELKDLMKSPERSDRKKAVDRAEKLLDGVLKAANFSGENLEKRMTKIPEGQLNFQEDIVWAYKLREQMDSDPDYEPDDEEIKRAFYIYERTLKEMNIL